MKNKVIGHVGCEKRYNAINNIIINVNLGLTQQAVYNLLKYKKIFYIFLCKVQLKYIGDQILEIRSTHFKKRTLSRGILFCIKNVK